MFIDNELIEAIRWFYLFFILLHNGL